MIDYIQKREKIAKIFKIIVLVLLAAFILLFIPPAVGIVEFEALVIPMAFLPVVLLIMSIIYLTVFHPVMSNVSWLKDNNYMNVADDIALGTPTLPKSKIYCGKNALFCNKPFLVIPYAEIGWVYLYIRKTNGITVEKAFIIYTRDGKKFSMNSDENEFQWLLENYIVKYSPNVVVGYGIEQKKQYRQINPNYKIAKSKTMKTVGIVFLCIGAVFLILSIATWKWDVTVLSIVIVSLIIGLLLIFISKKTIEKLK